MSPIRCQVQLGGEGANDAYQDYDKPHYPHGNTKLVIINIGSIGVFLLTKAYYVWMNKQKEKVWNVLTKGEQDEYLHTTKLRGVGGWISGLVIESLGD